jgi:hypothetical protein
MSWSMDGYIRDEPVYHQDEGRMTENFFQSGRHAAEERFWKLKIHEDGSFVRRNASSLDNFYTIKEALKAAEEKKEKEEAKRRQGSVEEESAESSTEEEEKEEDGREKKKQTERKLSNTIKKSLTKMREEQEGRRRDSEGRPDEHTREPLGDRELERVKELEYARGLERAQELERIRELERRERDLEARERDFDRRSVSREISPDYSYNLYKYRSRRNSEISNKDYPYSVCSEYTPSTTTIQEDGERREKSRFKEHGSVSSRYF